MLGRGARERTSDDDLSPEAIQWCEWEAQPADDGWLVSYADMLSVILAMVVLLLGRMVMANAPAVVSAQTTEAFCKLDSGPVNVSFVLFQFILKSFHKCKRICCTACKSA